MGDWLACSVQGRQVKEKVKSMLIIFFVIKGIVHRGQAVSSAYYWDDLWRMSKNMLRLCPQLWRQDTVSHFLFRQGNFYQKHNCLPHPPYFFLSSRLNIEVGGAILTQLRRSRQNHRRCWTSSQNTTFRMRLKMAEALGTVHTRGKGNYLQVYGEQ
jgi:hypothetical protein